MGNALVIRINDKSKTAVVKENVSVCGKYSVSVDPSVQGNGWIVLHKGICADAPSG